MSHLINSFSPIAVLGAGAWGTALALHLARKGQIVRLWAYEKEQVLQINSTRYNAKYLPNQKLPDNIFCSHNFEEIFKDLRDILVVVPSAVFRSTLIKIHPFLKADWRLFWATKGLDKDKHQLLHNVVSEILGPIDMAVLSGPSFAKEVAIGLPTAITIASKQEKFSHDLKDRFQTEDFRVEVTKDINGVELGGAIKNIIAIAVGVIEGLGFGANAKAALMTQGLSEIIELGKQLGAEEKTFLGLSGLGDLVLTCTDNQSRNRCLGLLLGKGQTLQQTQKIVGTTEGTITAKNVFYLLKKYRLKLPICESIYHILYEQKKPLTLLTTL